MPSDTLFSVLAKRIRIREEPASEAGSGSGGGGDSRFEEEFISQLSLSEAALPLIGNRWLDISRRCFSSAVAERDVALQRLTVRDRIAVIEQDKVSTGDSDGDYRMRQLRWILNNLGIVRSADQIVFHEAFIKACLPLIYGVREWETSMVRVLEEYNIKRIQAEVLIMTPRRWGKTWSIAMYCVAVALACPGIRIAIFSTGGRASNTLQSTMLEMLKAIAGAKDRIVKIGKEELFLSATPLDKGSGPQSAQAKDFQTQKTTSKIMSFPSSVNGLYPSLSYLLSHHS
jgi:hypothetical protein